VIPSVLVADICQVSSLWKCSSVPPKIVNMYCHLPPSTLVPFHVATIRRLNGVPFPRQLKIIGICWTIRGHSCGNPPRGRYISFRNTQLVQVAVVNDILVPYVAVQIDWLVGQVGGWSGSQFKQTDKLPAFHQVTIKVAISQIFFVLS
jgi:hypothetical protein